MKLFTVHISVVSRYLILLRSKYLPQYPILKHPQPVFFSEYGGPSFTLVLLLNIVPDHNSINFAVIFSCFSQKLFRKGFPVT